MSRDVHVDNPRPQLWTKLYPEKMVFFLSVACERRRISGSCFSIFFFGGGGGGKGQLPEIQCVRLRPQAILSEEWLKAHYHMTICDSCLFLVDKELSKQRRT